MNYRCRESYPGSFRSYDREMPELSSILIYCKKSRYGLRGSFKMITEFGKYMSA